MKLISQVFQISYLYNLRNNLDKFCIESMNFTLTLTIFIFMVNTLLKKKYVINIFFETYFIFIFIFKF